ETKAPAKSVGRSVLIAAPVIALMFVLGTSTVVAFIPTADIDLVGPLPQVLRIGFAPFGIAAELVTVAILMTLAMRVAQVSVMFAVPVFWLRGVTPPPPAWLKVVSMSGLLMTLLYVALSVFPIIKVESVAAFAFKIMLVIIAANLVGVGILISARRRAQAR